MLRTPIHRAIALALAAAGGAVLALGFAAPASAHAALLGTDPEDGATLETAPAAVSVTFSEILDGPSTEIAVTDPAGEVVPVEAAVFEGDTFTQPMLYTGPGEYTVAFRLYSEDGHRVDDAVRFTVESIPDELYAPGSAPAADGSEEPAASDPATADESETTAGTETTAAADAEDSNTGAALAAILLGLLVVVVGGVVFVKTLGRKQQTGDQGGSGSV